MSQLSGKTAVITGGTTGIGFATAREFRAQGARVIITGSHPDSVADARAALGDDVTGIVADVSRVTDIRRQSEEIRQAAGRIDILFVNAGIARFAPVDQVDEATWDASFNVNVKGAFFTIQQLLPLINEGGSIIINASINASIGMPNSSVYAASKAAVISLARTLSAELVARGIRVNAISPGPVETPLFGKLGIPEAQLSEMAGAIQNQVPMRRFGKPEEIARVATFLASPDSSFMLGSEVVVDGGMSTL